MPGSGQTVQETTERAFDIAAPVQLVTQRFADTLSFAEEWMVTAKGAMATLSQLATQFQLPAGWLDALNAVIVPSVTVMNPQQLQPSLGTLNIASNWPTNFPNLAPLQSVPNISLAYTAPIAPADVTPTLNYVPGTYNSAFYLQLYSTLYNYLQNGGTGLIPAVEAAITGRRVEAQRIANAKKYEDDMRAAGQTGFNFPGGVIAGIQVDSTAEILKQATDFNNQLVVQAYETEQKNMLAFMDNSINVEKMLRDFYNSTESRNFEAQKATAEFIIQVYAEKVKAYLAQWDGVKIDLESKVNVVDIIIKENTLLIDVFKAQTSGYISQVEAVTKQIEGQVEAFKGQVEAYKANTEAYVAYYNLLSTEQKLQIEVADLQLRKATESLKASLEAQIAFDNLLEKIAETQGHIAQQAVASALNAVNASATYGYSGSAQRSEQWAHHDSLTESDIYEHNPVN